MENVLMLNQCNFIGRLGADPELKRMQNGKPVANLRLAVSKKWRDGNGERQERTTWLPVVIFNEGLCRVAEQYLRKGSQVYVSGEFSVRKWQDQSGNDRYSTEIVLQGYSASLTMLDSSQTGQTNQDQGSDDPGEFGGGAGPMDSEIPF
jgi:single-strand DNA-binding protein